MKTDKVTRVDGNTFVVAGGPNNSTRITAREALSRAGLELDSPELNDSIVPACCDEGCEVEPDGKCEHGNPSVLLALGVI